VEHKATAQQNPETVAITAFQGFDYVTLHEIRFSFNVSKQQKTPATWLQ
jgi:hypothetical protein